MSKTLTIGITGAQGLLGWHLRCYFSYCTAWNIKCADRLTFSDQTMLEDFVTDCDVIIHLAGVNRADDEVIATVNLELCQQLTNACSAIQSKAHLIFSSSTQQELDNVYGRAKLACRDHLASFAEQQDMLFTNLVLPNVFGEYGKPFYNSVIATFAHQLAHRQEPVVHIDKEMMLLHCQQLAQKIEKIISEQQVGELHLVGERRTVSEVLVIMQEQARLYMDEQIIPAMPDHLSLNLFNCLRAQLYPRFYPVTYAMHSDERGGLFEATKSLNGGQSFVSTTKPGIVRGNHFHFHKIERFIVLSGQAKVQVRKIFSEEVTTFELSGDKPQFIDIPTLHCHNITNIGDETMTVMFWSHELYDPQNSDTYSEKP